MMQTIDVERRPVAPSVLKQTPSVDHGSRVLRAPITVVESGRPIMRALHLGVPEAFRIACERAKTTTGTRTRGLVATSASFGTMSRSVFANYCRSASMAREMPAEHAALTRQAITLTEMYREFDPGGLDRYTAATSAIAEEWRMHGTPYTSGNVNKNDVLSYHLDVGNTRDGSSAMMVVRERCTGGELVFPELGISFDLQDGDAIIFDGRETWHGVTPIVAGLGGYRTSVVYYSLRSAWQCIPWAAELALAKVHATRKARKDARKPSCDCIGPCRLACRRVLGE